MQAKENIRKGVECFRPSFLTNPSIPKVEKRTVYGDTINYRFPQPER